LPKNNDIIFYRMVGPLRIFICWFKSGEMANDRENGSDIDPKFDAAGLITAVITDAEDGTVLMVGHMNDMALARTRETGTVHFFSRSRQRLWQKGESSSHFLNVVEILIDCDQDALWIKAHPDGPTCHTGEKSCFYRRVTDIGLERI
jgi:phosphoribosyl-AMP cyclohydrolase